MIELRQKTTQTIIVGPFLDKTTNKVPITTITLAGLTYRHFVCSNWSIINLNTGRTWGPATGANGFYITQLAESETNFLGHGYLYFYNATTMSSPVVIVCNVISQNVYDAKYGSILLKTEPFAEKG